VEFRHKALENLRAPEELDEAVRLTRPGAWVALLVLTLVVVAGGVWAFEGRLPRRISAPGLLTHPQGVSSVQSTVTGQVKSIFLDPGSIIPNRTPVLAVDNGTEVQTVRVPFPGRVIGILVNVGQYITAGTTLATVERTDDPDDRLLAVLFVPASDAGQLRPGEDVDLTVASAPAQAFGVLRGRVSRVDQFSQTRKQIADFIGDDAGADAFTASGSPVRVTVDLVGDTSTVSGYQWSTKGGPPFRVDSQSRLTGAVHLASRQPISWILPR